MAASVLGRNLRGKLGRWKLGGGTQGTILGRVLTPSQLQRGQKGMGGSGLGTGVCR